VRVAEVAPPWFAIPPRGYGGIELIVHALGEGLSARGHEVTLFAPEGSTSAGEVVSPLPPAGADRIGDAWADAYHALSAIRWRDSFDVIHDHTITGPALGAVLDDGPPVVHTVHGSWTADTERYYRLVHERIALVAISDAQRRANASLDFAATIPNGIDLDRYPLGEGDREDFVVYIGRAVDDKAPDDAIRLARLAGRPLKLVCKQAEPDEVEYWDEFVRPLLDDDVEVIPQVNHEEKIDLLMHGSAFVFPIRWEEPFGLVVIEAMACGMPVVARPGGAVADLVIEGETGFLDDDLERLAEALGRVGEIAPAACRERVAGNFSSDVMVERYEELFRRLTEGG
jgi:glycosyltransferase involved in cell wall biosynthesis